MQYALEGNNRTKRQALPLIDRAGLCMPRLPAGERRRLRGRSINEKTRLPDGNGYAGYVYQRKVRLFRLRPP